MLLDKCHHNELWVVKVVILHATTKTSTNSNEDRISGKMLVKGHKPSIRR